MITSTDAIFFAGRCMGEAMTMPKENDRRTHLLTLCRACCEFVVNTSADKDKVDHAKMLCAAFDDEASR